MALLPPRVGEMYEYGARTARREARQRRFRVLGQHASAIAKAFRAQALIDERRPFAANLQPEHAHVGVNGETFEQEPAAAWANFKLDRGVVRAQQDARVDAFAFGKSRCIRVRVRFHVGVDAKTRRVLAQADSPRWLGIARSPWSFLAAAAALAALAMHQIMAATNGAPAVPLDDSYIHFQFARSFAEGHPFVYSHGSAPVAGATSLLWPLLLALPQLLGAHGLALIPWAWGYGFLALGLLAYETARAAERVTDPRVAWLAGVLVLTFSANTWFAASGMEVVPLAWLLMRSARRAAEWLEGDRHGLWELLLLAFVAPAMRPEGALASLLIASSLFLGERGARRAFGALALGFVAVPPLVNALFTGHATQTTTLVKWLPFNPYLTRTGLLDAVLGNVHLFVSTLLDGQLWSAAYVPAHSRFIALLALPALIFAGQARGSTARAWLLVALGLGILLPTTYDSFLWNRLRYLWPFAGPWLIGLVALADQLGELAALLTPTLGLVRYATCATFATLLASKFPFALEDLADSARAISSQHVELGEWAKRSLPPDARIGVNDTGAIAYFSNHPIFDIVGLTTAGEARYWSAGTGSRFEHYERLPLSALPTHFIVYSAWFGMPQLLGTCLTERTVYATILGGETMLACKADYSLLNSGERAAAPEFWHQNPLDVLDVADLESEAEHDYVVLPATQAEDVVSSNGIVMDGARRNRRHDSFRFQLAPGARFVARLGADARTTVNVRVAGQVIASWAVNDPIFEEHSVRLSTDAPHGVGQVELIADEPFSAAHYWLYPAPQ